MFGIKYVKFDPMQYVMHIAKGKIKKEGKGLSFYYWAPNSSLIAIPLASSDLPFVFKVTTVDFQTLTIQGQIVYKVIEPQALSKVLDYTVNASKRYLKDDCEKLSKRIINEAQNATIKEVSGQSLKTALANVRAVEKTIFTEMRNSDSMKTLGIDILGIKILGISPTPEIAKTLEAETREKILQEADLALYERRNFAVEQERIIKESELNTEIAVEEKEKQIAEQKMKTKLVNQENDQKIRELEVLADIKVETEKQKLVDMKVENEKKEVEVERLRILSVIDPLKELDWRSLMALGNQNIDAATNIAMAFRELAENAQKIGTLNITPELLESLLKKNPLDKRLTR